MNLYQFIGLETNQKAEYIPHGTYLATREEHNCCIFLYELNDFYAEVYFDVNKWEISHIHGFRGRGHLVPYAINKSYSNTL